MTPVNFHITEFPDKRKYSTNFNSFPTIEVFLSKALSRSEMEQMEQIAYKHLQSLHSRIPLRGFDISFNNISFALNTVECLMIKLANMCTSNLLFYHMMFLLDFLFLDPKTLNNYRKMRNCALYCISMDYRCEKFVNGGEALSYEKR